MCFPHAKKQPLALPIQEEHLKLSTARLAASLDVGKQYPVWIKDHEMNREREKKHFTNGEGAQKESKTPFQTLDQSLRHQLSKHERQENRKEYTGCLLNHTLELQVKNSSRI